MEEGEPKTWQNSTWWEFTPKDLIGYLANRYDFNETPEEGIVEITLEANDMPHDLLVQLVVYAAVGESKTAKQRGAKAVSGE